MLVLDVISTIIRTRHSFFLEGQFDVEVAGELYHIKEGDVAFVPRGTAHAFKNIGNTDVEVMTKISLQYGQEFVDPTL